MWELLWPPAVGAALVVAEPGAHRDPVRLLQLIETEGVTVVHFVPSVLEAVSAGTPARPDTPLRLVICSGEALPARTARLLAQRLPGVRLVNLYGPTEAAIDVTAGPADGGEVTATVPIGYPIANVSTRVLDRAGRPTLLGAVGELYLGGVALARGYLGRPGLTAERFVPDAQGGPGARLYRTGDLVRWTAGQGIEYVGRGDDQVKINGVRVELGEIDAAIAGAPGVRAGAAALVHRPRPALAGYLVPDRDGTDLAAVHRHLTTVLPDAVRPATLTVLPALPLSANGKLDRAKLPPPTPTHRVGRPGRRAPTPSG